MKEKTIDSLCREIDDIDYLINLITVNTELDILNYTYSFDNSTLSARPIPERQEEETKIRL